jgi:hypothetical protein
MASLSFGGDSHGNILRSIDHFFHTRRFDPTHWTSRYASGYDRFSIASMRNQPPKTGECNRVD